MTEDGGRSRAGRFPHAYIAGVLVFALQWVHGPAQGFIYDAVQYWGAPLALLTGRGVADVGVLQIRGVLSVFVYLPPAVATHLLGPATAVWTVLIWNALLASVICVLLVPRLASLLAPGAATARIWISAAVGGVVLSGFARYPHLDVWSAAFALTGLCFVATGRHWWAMALGGLSLAIATNLRPSYIAPLAIAGVILVVARRTALWALPGVALGLAPQALFNLMKFDTFSLSPIATPYLLNVQAQQAAFTIRYDTVAFVDRHPQQWFCDPAYARLLVDDTPPTSPIGVAASAFSHLPDSLWFLLQKAAAALHWSFATPNEYPPDDGISLMTFVIVGVSAFGIVGLFWRLVTSWSEREARMRMLAVIGFWFGALATLVLSTPETRFALPLALVGVVGLLVTVPVPRDTNGGRYRGAWIAAALAVALSLGLIIAGHAGLSHPVPPGSLTDAAMCAAIVAD